jgi:hypothetical protein
MLFGKCKQMPRQSLPAQSVGKEAYPELERRSCVRSRTGVAENGHSEGGETAYKSWPTLRRCRRSKSSFAPWKHGSALLQRRLRPWAAFFLGARPGSVGE